MSNLDLIAELLREQHGTKVTAQDLREIQFFLWEQSQSRLLRLSISGDPGYIEPTADVGKVAGFVFGAVLGAFFLPGLGIAAGWFAGAIIGGSIGYRLVGLFDGPGKSAGSTSTTDPLFRFSGVGQLATLNTPISKIYGNRSVNSVGGVLLRDPPKIYTRAYSRLGSRYLESLSILSYGQLGDVNLAGLKLDDKPIGDWEIGDIVAGVSPGINQQNGQSDYYCQAVSIGTNAFIGSNPVATVGTLAINRSQVTLGNFTNVSPSTSAIGKYNNNGNTNGWNAGATTQSLTAAGGYGSYLVVQGFVWASNTDLLVAIGFTNGELATNPTNMLYGVEVFRNGSGAGWRLFVGGVVVATGGLTIAAATDKTKIEIRVCRYEPQRAIEVYIRDAIVHRQLVTLSYPYTLTGALAINNLDNIIESIQVGICLEGGGDISPGYGTHYMAKNEVLSKLKSAQLYSANNANDFTVVGKDTKFNFLTTNQTVDLYGGSKLQVFYRAAVTTSKAVTSIELILQATIFARNDKGDFLTHAQAFRLIIKFPDGNKYEIIQLIIISKTENSLIRSFTINGLPKAIYQVMLTPLSEFDINGNIQSLDDNSSLTTIATAGTGISLSGEFGAILDRDTARSYLTYTGKAQTSADRGAQIQITHVNEIVSAPTPPTYPGYAIAYLKLLASDRLQNAPAETHDIPKGAIVPNYLAASFLSIDGANRFTFVNAIIFPIGFANAPSQIQAGYILKVIGAGIKVITQVLDLNTVDCNPYWANVTTIQGQSTISVSPFDYANILRWMPISSGALPPKSYVIRKLDSNRLEIGGLNGEAKNAIVSSTGQATFNAFVSGKAGDETVIYAMDSSCWFPDLYVDRLINSADGLGNYVDPDHFIDYPSIVKSRAFCVRNKFYFDGVVADGSFEQWATTTAPSSLLFCTEIDGRYGLVTQEDGDPNPFLFNDSNVIKYTEPGVPWQQELTNVVLVKYQDNLGREKQIKIATIAAANGLEPEVVQTIECHGVTAIDQAIKVGQTSLKSLKLQSRACQIETDVSSGLYCRQGDIVRTQHTAIEYGNERNGFVMSATPPDNGRFEIANSVEIISIASGYLVATAPHQLTRFSGGISNTDRVVISGNSQSANNRTLDASSLTWIDDRSIVISPAPTTVAGTGGTLTVQRFVYDQIIKVSETIVITPNSRITLVHAKTRTAEQDRQIVDMGDGTYKVIGIKEPISFGDAWSVGELGSIDRRWRITSLQPDVNSNKVVVTGVLWSSDILSPAGLVTIS